MKKQIHFRTSESQVLINGKAIDTTQKVNKLPPEQLEVYQKLHDELAKKAFARLDNSANRITLHIFSFVFRNYRIDSVDDLEAKYVELINKIEPLFKSKQVYKIYRYRCLKNYLSPHSHPLPKVYYKIKKAIMKKPVLPSSYEINRLETKIIEYLEELEP